jgi:hypothetical protein
MLDIWGASSGWETRDRAVVATELTIRCDRAGATARPALEIRSGRRYAGRHIIERSRQ